MLEGITRRTVLELAAKSGIPADVRSLDVDALHAADEVFITSTAGGVMPVRSVDGRRVGTGLPGPVTTTIRNAYWSAHRAGPWTEAVTYPS